MTIMNWLPIVGRGRRLAGASPILTATGAALMLGCLSIVSGCTRTSDGTIQTAIPLTLDSMPLRPVWPRSSTRQSSASLAAGEFPDTPSPPARRNTSGKRLVRSGPAMPRFAIATNPILRPAAEQPAKPITCREAATGSGNRRVVCD